MMRVLRVRQSRLITCMDGDFVQVVYVSVVCVRIASNVDERRAGDLCRRWSRGFVAGDPFHGCECGEGGIESNEVAMIGRKHVDGTASCARSRCTLYRTKSGFRPF